MESIIVYRNPLEAAMWNTLASGAAFPYIAGMLGFFIMIWITTSLLDNVRFNSFKSRNFASYVALTVSALFGIGTVYLLML